MGDIRNREADSLTLKLKVLYFGEIREVAGVSKEKISLTDHSTLDVLLTKIAMAHPKILKFSFQVAVNRLVAREKIRLKNGDEIAIFPPVTGG